MNCGRAPTTETIRTLETVLASLDPGRVPQHGIHDGPQLKAGAGAPGDLIVEQASEVRRVEVPFGAQGRSLERRAASRAEIGLAEPLVHRRAEPLLAPVD